MAGLPKKYAKMGFAKGWRAYRASKTTSYSTNKVKPMARRRSGFFRKKARQIVRQGPTPMQTAIAAVAYGAVRQKTSAMIQPFTSKIPLGTVADELVLGTAGYFLAKKSKNKMLKAAGTAILTVEAARVGEAIADGSLMGN